MRFPGDAYDKVYPRSTVKEDVIPEDEKMVDDKNADDVDDKVVDDKPPVEDKQPGSENPDDAKDE